MKKILAIEVNFLLVLLCFSLPLFIFYNFFVLIKEFYYFWGDNVLWERLLLYLRHFQFLLNFILALIMFLMGVCINLFLIKYISFNRPKFLHKIIILLCVLICIDQLTQLLIKNYGATININIIKDWFEIRPILVKNDSDDYISMGQLPIKFFLSLLPVFILLLLLVFRFLNYFYSEKSHLYLFMIFFASGYLCSISNRVFHNHGYDYIYVRNIAIFDIKDMYLYIGLCLFFQSVGINYLHLKKFTNKDIFLYFQNEYEHIKRLLIKRSRNGA